MFIHFHSYSILILISHLLRYLCLNFFRTCVSGQATTSSISRTPRNSKFHFTKLKRMLNLEEKEKSQKVDLKSFLTSL